MTPKIFGREPAVLAALVEALLALLVSFGALTGLGIKGQPELMLTMAVVNGVVGLYVAYVTRDTLLGAAIALVKAFIAFCAIYGLTLSTEQTGALIAFLTLAIGLFQRTQTGPATTSSFNLGDHSAVAGGLTGAQLKDYEVQFANRERAAAELARAVREGAELARAVREGAEQGIHSLDETLDRIQAAQEALGQKVRASTDSSQ